MNYLRLSVGASGKPLTRRHHTENERWSPSDAPHESGRVSKVEGLSFFPEILKGQNWPPLPVQLTTLSTYLPERTPGARWCLPRLLTIDLHVYPIPPLLSGCHGPRWRRWNHSMQQSGWWPDALPCAPRRAVHPPAKTEHDQDVRQGFDQLLDRRNAASSFQCGPGTASPRPACEKVCAW